MAIPSAYPRTHDEAALFEPYTYICSNPGKEIRTQLIEAFNIWIKVPPEELAIITKVVKMLHTSSLLIDDIEDDSILRRGEPVAHKIFGVPATINCANYVYFLALAELTKIPNPKMLTIFTEELLCLHRGQGMELLWRDTLTCPTEEEFIAMVNDKTGGLLRLAVKLMQAASNCQVDYVPMVELIGIHFQIRDDYLNLQSNQQKPTTPELKVYALNLMHKTRTFEYCREKMRFYEAKAREEIRRLGGNSRLEKIIDCLSIPDLTIDAAKDAPIVVAP
ncbi:geranylgeranyl pyrophosphate synthetase [Lobosporangium transversale]|nr:geranylgeranyl pyrophosphate synthetase [Lobosporangium transversale]